MILLAQSTVSNMTLGELSIYFAFVIAAMKGVWEFSKFVIKIFRKWHNSENIKEEKEETLQSHSKQISEMDVRHKEDYQQINSKIDTLTSTLDKFIGETKKDNQVILRDKIYDAYKITLQKGYILEKDSKNYHYALERYIANEGNSYVVDEIEPRMKDFKVFLCDEDAEEYFKKSR
jgi:hypothetical protein